jgi:hypothetical protein
VTSELASARPSEQMMAKAEAPSGTITKPQVLSSQGFDL